MIGLVLLAGCSQYVTKDDLANLSRPVQLPEDARIIQRGDHLQFLWHDSQAGDVLENCQWAPKATGYAEDGFCYSEMLTSPL